MDTRLVPVAGKVSGDCQAQDWSSSGPATGMSSAVFINPAGAQTPEIVNAA
jgi:hypothetical protein